MRSVGFLETLRRDLRYGARQIRRNPSFASLAVLTLALGIGSVTVMYSVIRNVLLDPFPYTNSERLVDVLVVALGIYGVLAYTVSRQTHEIAIRMALGGERRHVPGFVLRLGLQLIAAGIVAGLAASAATNRLISNQLWNTSPYDPLTLTLAIAVITLVGLAACYAPAARAVRVDPMAALRLE